MFLFKVNIKFKVYVKFNINLNLYFFVSEKKVLPWKEAAVKLRGVEGDNPVLISDLTK